MGNIPISIATALAIDGLYNRHPDIKPVSPIPATKAKKIYINARTLHRNIMGAVGDNDKAMNVKPREYAEVIIHEVNEIQSALSQEGYPLELVWYLPTYHSIAKKCGNGELRQLTTDNQKAKNKLENDTLQFIVEHYKSLEVKPYLAVDMEIEVAQYSDIFIMTHLPVDLLFIKNVADVYLVESHTGKVKPKEQWYTKFYSDKSPRIPFTKGTLLFLGDSGGFFKPQPVKARRRLLEIAESRKWNAHTTESRMFLGLELDKEPHLLNTLKTLSR